MADLGGACQAHATLYGTQFFHFCIHFHQKAPASEVHAPLMDACPPTGNPGSTTAHDNIMALLIPPYPPNYKDHYNIPCGLSEVKNKTVVRTATSNRYHLNV